MWKSKSPGTKVAIVVTLGAAIAVLGYAFSDWQQPRAVAPQGEIQEPATGGTSE